MEGGGRENRGPRAAALADYFIEAGGDVIAGLVRRGTGTEVTTMRLVVMETSRVGGVGVYDLLYVQHDQADGDCCGERWEAGRGNKKEWAGGNKGIYEKKSG